MNREEKQAEIKVCTWCKDQISTGEKEHIDKCTSIPDEEKRALNAQHKKPIATITVDKTK
jgi:hypothetical protein